MTRDPWFRFYPADWYNDIKLQACSLASQGLLINLMCLMHQSEKYGYLLINGRMPNPKSLIKLSRLHHKTFKGHLKELLDNGVLKEDEQGVIYCPRMVKDQEVRQEKQRAGAMGGNPYLVKQPVKQGVKHNSQKSEKDSLDLSFLKRTADRCYAVSGGGCAALWSEYEHQTTESCHYCRKFNRFRKGE